MAEQPFHLTPRGLARLTNAVRAHAARLRHIERWAYVNDRMGDPELAKVVVGARTEAAAIRRVTEYTRYT